MKQQKLASELGHKARWGDPVERFWSHVWKTDGCWWWTGKKDFGYGKVRINNVEWRAHRYSWFLVNGPIAEGVVICHSCDNKSRVRPDHLFAGTQTDNMQDAKRKGLAYRPGQHGTQGADGRWSRKTAVDGVSVSVSGQLPHDEICGDCGHPVSEHGEGRGHR